LNVFKPLIALDTLDSLRLLAGAMDGLRSYCVDGIVVNTERIGQLVASSLMLVTALVPHIGYDLAAQVAKHAEAHHLTLRAAALTLGAVSAEDFDRWVDPLQMLGR
jgi:fumarate hydratase class II